MTGSEVATALAVIANWRGKALDDGERAAWRNRLWSIDADEFSMAMDAWGRSPKAELRPSIGELFALLPRSGQSERYGEFPPVDDEPRTEAAVLAANKVLEQFAHLRPSTRRQEAENASVGTGVAPDPDSGKTTPS